VSVRAEAWPNADVVFPCPARDHEQNTLARLALSFSAADPLQQRHLRQF